MSAKCEICDEISKYKCPKCLIRYCSVGCFKTHKDSCTETSTSQAQIVQEKVDCCSSDVKPIDLHILNLPSKDTVPVKSLEKLKDSGEVRNLLQKEELREMLQKLSSCSDENEAKNEMDKLMRNKTFRDYANACMKIVSPETNTFEHDDEFTS